MFGVLNYIQAIITEAGKLNITQNIVDQQINTYLDRMIYLVENHKVIQLVRQLAENPVFRDAFTDEDKFAFINYIAGILKGEIKIDDVIKDKPIETYLEDMIAVISDNY